MANKDELLVNYKILAYYVQAIQAACTSHYPQKADTLQHIRIGNAIPTGVPGSTPVLCIICTYVDGTVINIDASGLSAGLQDVVSTADLEAALDAYTTTADLVKDYVNNTSLSAILADYIKSADAYNPANKTTLDLFSQAAGGSLLFNGIPVVSSGGGSVDTVNGISPDNTKNISLGLDDIPDGQTRKLYSAGTITPSDTDYTAEVKADGSGKLYVSSSAGSGGKTDAEMMAEIEAVLAKY